MLSSTLLVLATSLVSGAVAASAPVCASSGAGYNVGQVNYLFNSFCNQLEGSKFASQQQVYGMPYISFNYQAASTACTLDNCLASYQKLVSSCALPNATIWGTGSLDAGCGVYKFQIWNTEDYPVALGSPTTTIQGATLTTAPLITATSTPSPSITPVSTYSMVIPTSSKSSSSLQSAYYSNGTSTAIYSASAVASGSVVVVSASSTGSSIAPANPTSTSTSKPAATTAVGSGADMLRASGLSLVTVACVFGWWM